MGAKAGEGARGSVAWEARIHLPPTRKPATGLNHFENGANARRQRTEMLWMKQIFTSFKVQKIHHIFDSA